MHRLRIVRLWNNFAAEKEVRRHQHRLERELHAAFKTVLLLLRDGVDAHQAINFIVADRSPKCAASELRNDFSRAIVLVVLARLTRKNTAVRFRERDGRAIGSDDLDVVDKQSP